MKSDRKITFHILQLVYRRNFFMRKKHLCIILTALVLSSLTGCGGKKADTETTQAPLETIQPAG